MRRADDREPNAGPGDKCVSMVDQAMDLASRAFQAQCLSARDTRRDLLLDVARRLDARVADIVAMADSETHLGTDRLQSELERTTGQLRFFAGVVADGSWVDARIDRGPPDLRRILVPVGPVVVYGASNFPLAFSTPGGDTASALAAGCPVVVKGHPAHPGTSDLVALAFTATLTSLDLPAGVFQLLHGDVDVAERLVDHPRTAAVGFTGSFTAGRALFNRALSRDTPIPVFAEMGSQNPVFVLPGAAASRGSDIASGLAESASLGVGQFCTKPGVVVGIGIADLASEVGIQMADRQSGTMLTPQHGESFATAVRAIEEIPGVELLAGGADPGVPTCMLTEAATFLARSELRQEVFGPMTLMVSCTDAEELLEVAARFEGQLVGSIHGESVDGVLSAELAAILLRRVGRIVYNGYPTGVAVAHSMQHGGPYPATTDSRWTSVGSAAILRFARPICFQDAPHDIFPPELRDENPLGIERLVDGERTLDPIGA